MSADSTAKLRLLRSPCTRTPIACSPGRHASRKLSDGIFDASIAAQPVEWGILNAPEAAAPADPNATFRDIELLPGRQVRFKRPLWLDLSGIAKGYAVDRAIAALARSGITRACVNAGGDLRILGKQAERVALRAAVPSARLAADD